MLVRWFAGDAVYLLDMAETTSFIRPEIIWRTIGLMPNQTVVHLGCGVGFYIVAAAKIVGQGGQGIGVDILPHMLAETVSRASREGVSSIVRTIRADIESEKGTTLANASADVVLMVNILHQSHPGKVLSEAKRIMKPDGQMIIIAYNSVPAGFGPSLEKRISQEVMSAVLTQHKLRVIKTISPSPYHYGLVVKNI